MKIKKTLIIGLALFLLLPILELPIYRVFGQEDSTATDKKGILEWGRVAVKPANLGIKISMSDEENTICNSNEFISIGFNIEIYENRMKIWKFIFGISFYQKDKKTYPLPHAGIELLDILQLCGGFDLGEIDNKIKSDWEKRAVLLIGCDLLRVLKR